MCSFLNHLNGFMQDGSTSANGVMEKNSVSQDGVDENVTGLRIDEVSGSN